MEMMPLQQRSPAELLFDSQKVLVVLFNKFSLCERNGLCLARGQGSV